MEQKAFINQIKNGACACYIKYGILPSLTIAQAALESGWGSSSIGNNIFGIKAGSSWKGKTQTVLTTEFVNGQYIKVNATFRDYNSIDDSIIDHAKLLTLNRYMPVVQAKDYKEACKQVQQCGYATDPNYANKLISIIETYKLNQYDTKEETKMDKFTSAIDAINYLHEKGRISSPELWITEVNNGVIKYIESIFIGWANDILQDNTHCVK
jgi:flagellum-specific peptidoglycan hydrolase FlgJ